MASELTLEEVTQTTGPVVLEFGASWCPICQHARPMIDRALAEYPHVRHLSVEDGKGKPLGRSFRVKLWPTLIFLKNGHEVSRVVRPDGVQALRSSLGALDPI